jgi:predicted permease
MVFMTDSSVGNLAGFGNYLPISYPNFEDIRDQNDVFEQLTAVSFGGGILTGEEEPQQLAGFLVTHEYFDVLGIEPALGRFFRPDEDATPGTHNVVVISHGLWERQFGADPGILGSTLDINGVPFTVVGVAPEGFTGTVQGLQPDLIWTPFMSYPVILPENLRDWPESRRAGLLFSVIGRLAPGVSHEQAGAAVSTIADRLAREYPEVNSNRGAEVTEFTQLFNPTLQTGATAVGGVLMGIVGLVLLIACANVANLLLARAATREKEISVRLALGAGRHRLVRQLLTESVLLAVLGAGMGLLIAFWAGDLLSSIAPALLGGGGLPLQVDTALDGTVLAFTVGIALLTGVLFGLAPAVQVSKPQLASALHEGGRGGSAGGKQQLLRSALVVGEIALALVALVSAGLFIRSMQAAQQLDPGFETYELATIGLNPAGIGYDQGRAEQFFEELMESTDALGRVESVAIASSAPLGFDLTRTFIPQGWEETEGKYTTVTTVSPRYFETIGVPLLQGRAFTQFDSADSRRVAIINQAAKELFWPDEDAVGKRFRYITEEFDIEVVAVVANVIGQIGQPVAPISYVPAKQRFQGTMALHVRTDGDPEPALAEVQGLIRQIDRNMPTANPATIEQTLANALQQSRVIAGMLGTLGVLGLVLALIGTYGLMSYSVNQRRREIGIRVALGARGAEVMRLVVRQGMVLVALGVALGVVLSWAATRAFASLLFDVSTTDAVTFVTVPVLLVIVGLIASWVPARRVLRVDPVTALRNE